MTGPQRERYFEVPLGNFILFIYSAQYLNFMNNDLISTTS